MVLQRDAARRHQPFQRHLGLQAFEFGFVLLVPLLMHFPARAGLRKPQGLTQQTLADAVGVHANQIKRYESGNAQPTLETLVSLAKISAH